MTGRQENTLCSTDTDYCSRTPKISYVASRYVSFARVAAAYRRIIGAKYKMVTSPIQADIVVLHLTARNFDSIYEPVSSLAGRYLIGYCVWEADELPDAYKRSIAILQEVWTCSQYCCRVFQKYHPRVTYIPHVAERDISCSDFARNSMRRMIGYDPGCVYYLSVARFGDKRKNVAALVDTFERMARVMPGARLVIKAAPDERFCSQSNSRIIVLPFAMSDVFVNALYELSDVYVSAHHSEGWCLTLSDAMIFGKPVIGTGYSGNLDFMNSRNSFLLDTVEANILSEDCFGLFTTRMKWGYPSKSDLENKLLFVYENLRNQFVIDKARQAYEELAAFSEFAVARLLYRRLAELAESHSK